METLLKGKYVKVTKKKSDELLTVTLKCACCQRYMPSFQIRPERLVEWQEWIKDEKKYQPLCRPCARAHKKWHPMKGVEKC